MQTTGTVYERASTPISTKSSDQVIKCVSITHARRHYLMLLLLQFFPLPLLSSQWKCVCFLKTKVIECSSQFWMNTGYSTKILMFQIDRRPADALPCARVTASRGRDHETLSTAKLDCDRSATGLTSSSCSFQNCLFFFKRTSSYPPPSQTNIVRLKQNADKWWRPLCRLSASCLFF